MNQHTKKAARRFSPIPEMRAPSDKALDSFCRRHGLDAHGKTLIKDRLDSLRYHVNLRHPFHIQAETEKSSLTRAAKYSKALRAELVSMNGPMGIGVGNSLAPEFIRLAGFDWIRHGLAMRKDGTSQNEEAAKAFPALGIEVLAPQTAQFLLFRLLKTFEGGISNAFETMKAQKSGRKPKQLREVTLVNFAQIYTELGRKPSPQPGSAFAGFATEAFELVGWKSQATGFDDAIPAALNVWKNYHQK